MLNALSTTADSKGTAAVLADGYDASRVAMCFFIAAADASSA